MGSDKARLSRGVEPLLERVCRVSLATGADVVVVGRSQPEDWCGPRDERLSFRQDTQPGLGPAGGLRTLLAPSGSLAPDEVALLACDTPALSLEALRWLLSLPSGPLGVIPTMEGAAGEPVAQVLFARYQTSVAPVLEARILSGRYSLRGLIVDQGFAKVPLPSRFSAAIKDVDTPAEFRAFEG